MPATMPSQQPEWNSGGANRVDPASGQKVTGWTAGQAPPSSFLNWWQNLVYQWTLYLQDFPAIAHTWLVTQVFSAIATFSDGLSATRTTANTDAITGTGNGTGHGVKGVAAANAASRGVKATSTLGPAAEATGGIGATYTNPPIVGWLGSGWIAGFLGVARGAMTGVLGAAGFTDLSVMSTQGGAVEGIAKGGGVRALTATRQIGFPSTGTIPEPVAYMKGGWQGALNNYPAGTTLALEGGACDDPAQNLEGQPGQALTAKGGDAFGSTLNPAVIMNGAPAATLTGGNVDGAASMGSPAPALKLVGGVNTNPAFGVGAVRRVALEATGDLQVTGAVKVAGNEAATTPQSNLLSAGLVCKAWARIRVASGVYTILAGQNVTSFVAGANPAMGQCKLNLASPIPRATRSIVITSDYPSHAAFPYDVSGTLGGTDTTVGIEVDSANATGTGINLTTTTVILHVVIFGLQ